MAWKPVDEKHEKRLSLESVCCRAKAELRSLRCLAGIMTRRTGVMLLDLETVSEWGGRIKQSGVYLLPLHVPRCFRGREAEDMVDSYLIGLLYIPGS